MISKWSDKFDRPDGEVGDQYTVACGAAQLFEESVWPVSSAEAQSGDSPALGGTTAQKTQVLYTEQELDGSNQAVRAVWSHADSIIGFVDIDQLTALATTDPSFTVVARMTKDPLLVDLGLAEQPECYDQGYGLRVTCPRDGSAPILKIVKYSPRAIAPGIPGPSTPTEVDRALVLASVVLSGSDLNVDPSWDGTGNPPYRGFVQDMRLRIRRKDDQVILEGYLNDRYVHEPAIRYVDRAHPLWGATGRPGFEFLSATSVQQPAGSSPYNLRGVPLMACHLFEAETVKEQAAPRTSAPENRFTYTRTAERVLTLVEKNGDAKYTATVSGRTKLQTYLGFVTEAEREIIRKEGYYSWLYREEPIYLVDGQTDYELPEDCGELEIVRPGTWNAPPLDELTRDDVSRRVANTAGGGNPVVFSQVTQGPNNRRVLRLWPTPLVSETADPPPTIVVEYYARLVEPTDPDSEIPFVPQEHIDVLIYAAAAKALLIDPDATNAQLFAAEAEKLLRDLRVANNRKHATRRTVMRSVADIAMEGFPSRGPLTRSSQLGYPFLI